jgi:hypothetical protein
VTAIEGRALQSNGPVSWSGLQTEFVEQTPGKNASAQSSTKGGIEAVRLCAFSPPGLPLDRHNVEVLPLAMNDAGQQAAEKTSDGSCFD